MKGDRFDFIAQFNRTGEIYPGRNPHWGIWYLKYLGDTETVGFYFDGNRYD